MADIHETEFTAIELENTEGWYYGREGDKHMVSCGPSDNISSGGVGESWLFNADVSTANESSSSGPSHHITSGGADESWFFGDA
ncbi:MAG: hypothetical protein ACO3MW_04430 [Rhodospirillales bacterium]